MLSALWRALQDLIFPPHCLHCSAQLPDSHPPLFCAHCLEAIQYIRSPLCLCCGRPLLAGNNRLCGNCLTNPPQYDKARSLFAYASPIDQHLLALKFRGQLTGLSSLQQLSLSVDFLQDFSIPDYIIPVPLHRKRLQERGFNQALLLARTLCYPWQDKIHPDILRRSYPTVPQATLNGKERRHNLRGAFLVHTPQKVTGKKILLVDDVFTTGSTVNECSRVLRQTKAKSIEVLTLARSLSG